MNNYAQYSELCKIKNSETIDALKVDKEKLICIAKNSEKPYTLFYTLASWCAPCRLHYPDVVNLEKAGKINLFVILVESEKDKGILNAINFIKSYSENIKFGVLNDESYGTKTGKRNKEFVQEITPNNFETIEDYGKFILVDNSGKILFVSTWKDFENDWKNSKKMIENKILPLLN